MRLIDRFHRMELESSLFELGKENDLPVWDIIRYHVYREYYYPKEDAKRFFIPQTHKSSDYWYLFINLLIFIYSMIFKRAKVVILSSSRYRNSTGDYYDKSAIPIVQTAKEDGIVIEAILGKKTAYKYVYDFNNVFSRFFKSKALPRHYYEKIQDALIKHLGENKISYEQIKGIYHEYYSDCFYYKWVFSRLKTKKLFIVPGNPKATVHVARKLYIKTYLVQHAGIEFDEVDYSYPKGISKTSNVLFPDYLLTLGDYWCQGINVPTGAIIPVGNDFFCSKPIENIDNSILVVSTIVHGGELSRLTKELALLKPDLKFVFKLHPNEYHYISDYEDIFSGCKNVVVLSDQVDTNSLIARAQLVLLIVSAVVYEALNQNKKVAIYKRINYERQLILSSLQNVYFVDSANEVLDLIPLETIKADVDFYKPTDFDVLGKLINDQV